MSAPRVQEELIHLRKFYPKLEFVEKGLWIRIPDFPLPQDKDKLWNRERTDVAFQIPIQYPGTHPYGFFVPSGLTCNGTAPKEYQDQCSEQLPFDGQWGKFSWSPVGGQWKPSSDILVAGANLLNFVRTFTDRFKEGV
jgi:hypothetical protein